MEASLPIDSSCKDCGTYTSNRATFAFLEAEAGVFETSKALVAMCLDCAKCFGGSRE